MASWKLVVITIALIAPLAIAPSTAVAVTISTSANPADGWRAIAPVGNLQGQPIAAVGLAWEAGHLGWNNSLTFDDSDAAGWHPPVVRDVIQYGATTTNSIWADDPSGAGDTPAYFRKIFTLDSDPVLAQLGGTFFVTDASSVIDDDAQVYLNGALIFDDQDFFPTHFPLTDVTAYLHAGQNLIAVKAQDSVGGDEHFSITLRVDAIPEPDTGLLVMTGLIGLAYRRRRHARAHVTRKRRLDRRGRRQTTSVAAVIAVVLACAAIGRASAATYFTPTQKELLNADDITDLFGGNGSILSATADGDGVLFEIAGGTIDFGKVAARVRGPRDLSAFDGYALHVDIVLASNPVEVNPFIQTGSNGQLFVQNVPGVKQQGDSFDTIVPFAGVQNIDNVYGFGFQYFTGGDIEAPLAQTVTIRVTPVPEPSAGVLVGAGVCVLAVFRRRGTAAARVLIE